MQKMTPAEVRSFLLDQARTAKLATVRADGRPHIAPVWFDLDGDTLVFTTWHTSVKAANLRRDPRVCLCVDEETPPFSFVQIEEGVAEIGKRGKKAGIRGRLTRPDEAKEEGEGQKRRSNADFGGARGHFRRVWPDGGA